MNDESLYARAQALEKQIKIILSGGSNDVVDRKIVSALKRDMTDARLDIRDYEFAETKAEQMRYGVEAAKRLDRVRKNILLVSQQGIFGPVDVALLSAEIDRIIEDISN